MNRPGTIYLLHFSEPVGDTSRPGSQAQHYIGWTGRTPELRLIEHKEGGGCPLVRAAHLQGIEITIARTWSGDRHLERRLKKRMNHKLLCPCCSGEKAWRRGNYSQAIPEQFPAHSGDGHAVSVDLLF